MTNKTPEDKPGRNDRCHCGSGKKYKQCCLGKDEAAEREARAEQAAAAEAAAAESGEAAEEATAGNAPAAKAKRSETSQPWRKGAQNARAFQKSTTRRKVGSS